MAAASPLAVFDVKQVLRDSGSLLLQRSFEALGFVVVSAETTVM